MTTPRAALLLVWLKRYLSIVSMLVMVGKARKETATEVSSVMKATISTPVEILNRTDDRFIFRSFLG